MGGEAGPATVLPHELMEAAVVLGIIGVLLIVLGVVGLWLLVKIHRRLKDSAPPRPHSQSQSPPTAPDQAGQG